MTGSANRRAFLLWQILPLAGVLAPHARQMPLWISLAWLLCAGWSLHAIGHTRHPWEKWLKSALVLAGTGGVLLQFGTVLGPVGGIAMLVFLSGAKLLECDSRRDRTAILFLGCFLLVAYFLSAQDLPSAAYMALAAVGLVAGLIANQGPPQPQWDGAAIRRTLALSARLLLQALPLALFLFLLFPRLHGPLWGLPQQGIARTGLSDRMSPGDFGRLILSDEIAFRVEFTGTNPESSALYWRGPVLWDYDGRTWLTRGPIPRDPLEGVGRGPTLRYTITLEPHHQRWLFLLGLPKTLPPLAADLTPDWQWVARQPVTQRLRYQVEAYPDYLMNSELSPAARARALALPEWVNPRARRLARGWADSAATPMTIVNQALARFRTESFYYTLNPPALGEDAVDDFLFGAKRGFCEHYASSFVFLMRAAGIPARVVTGYQGGEYNRLGNYWIVRDRDAHAWAEVWLQGRGWVRVDPTAAVAPDRVERGLEAALPASERRVGLVDLDGNWLRPLRLGWDLLNNNWNQWVLGYDQQRQRRLLSSLMPMLGTLQGMVIAMVASSAVILLILSARLFRLRAPPGDATDRAFDSFCRKLVSLGVTRGAAEGPENFAGRAALARPDLTDDILEITRMYVGLKYGNLDGSDRKLRLGSLAAAVRRFRPPRRAP